MEATLNDIKHNKPMKEKKKRVDSLMELSEDDELSAGGSKEDEKKKKAVSSMKSCQAEKCAADLSGAKPYHRRHKVCEHHAKAQMVVVAGFRQRFCQQCSRFHEVCEFDEAKRSCRRRLAGHNERRRKNPTDNQAEGSSSSSRIKGSSTQLKANVWGQVEDRGRSIQRKVQENANYKHFHVS